MKHYTFKGLVTMRNQSFIKTIKTYSLIFISLFLIVPSSSVYAKEKILECSSYYYKMSENWFGLKKEFQKQLIQSSGGWKPICREGEVKNINGYRVTCTYQKSFETRINFKKPVAQAKKYKCPESATFPNRPFFEEGFISPNQINKWKDTWGKGGTSEKSNIARIISRWKSIESFTQPSEEHFRNIGCFFYGDTRTIFAVESRTNGGDWTFQPFPKFYPFSRRSVGDEGAAEHYERQVFDKARSHRFGKAVSNKTIIDFEIPRIITQNYTLNPKTLKPFEYKSPTVHKCIVKDLSN